MIPPAHLHLTLDSKLHIYNPKYKTFHISMEHLFGWDSKVVGRPLSESLRNVTTPIKATNDSTGRTVMFDFMDTNNAEGCRCYTGVDTKTSVQYKLVLWADIDALREHYTAKRDVFGLVSGLHENK